MKQKMKEKKEKKKMKGMPVFEVVGVRKAKSKTSDRKSGSACHRLSDLHHPVHPHK